MLKILDLFSGCGGLTEGFTRKPFDILTHIEMDKDACLSLKTRSAFHFLRQSGKLQIYYDYLQDKISREELYSNIPKEILDKVLCTEISSETIESIFREVDRNLGSEKIHGIIGGPPCQAYSTIGRARNKKIISEDKRIYLYEYYVQFLEKYKPDFFLFENVKGLLSFKDQYNELLFPKILKSFSIAGYSIEFKILNSASYGVSQSRERLFIYGERKDSSLFDDKQSFFDVLSRYVEEPLIINDLFSDLPFMNDGDTINVYTREVLAGEKLSYYRNKDSVLSQNISRKHNNKDKEIYSIVSKAKSQGKQQKYGDLPKRLQTHKNKKAFIDRFKAIDGEGVSHTVVAHISKDGHYYIHPDYKQNRSISVREAARIQSFSDDFYFESSRTAAFKQIGNAVPPKLSSKLSAAVIEKLKKKL